MRDQPKRATSTLTNIAVLERELGNLEYRLWKGPDDPGALRGRRDDLLRLLDEENARLERLRSEQDPRDRTE